VVRFVPLEERGLHRDWRTTSKKWALVQKSPPRPLRTRGQCRALDVMQDAPSRAAECARAAIDRLQLGCRRMLCRDAVPAMAVAEQYQPEQEAITCDSCSVTRRHERAR
jgi:hypothetical protein